MAKTKQAPRKLPVDRDKLNARPDTIDFRDRMYVPTLVEVPMHIPLQTYKDYFAPGKVPVLDQGEEGACTGFALAAVAHFLLHRRQVEPDSARVSPHMFYSMARRYDEWAGEDYSGSSARGAMKGWHKHGVCSLDAWPKGEGGEEKRSAVALTHVRATDAAKRPLGAYFRVNHKDLVAMHSALAEVGILYATATVHQGWEEIGADGVIPLSDKPLGGHAFALVGYDKQGFWIQNSWGPGWGKGGFAKITYDDWLTYGSDVWVARLGAPVLALEKDGSSAFAAMTSRSEYSFSDLRAHVVTIGNDGLLRGKGQFGNTPRDVEAIFTQDIPRLMTGWKKKRILLFAHGGLVGEENALQRIEEYRRPFLDAQIYPLAFIWRTDFWTTMGNILRDALSRRRPEGIWDAGKDFMLDRLDDTLEPLARPLGKAQWDQMKGNALMATERPEGGGSAVLNQLAAWLEGNPGAEVHIACHSAGSIFMAPMVKQLTEKGLPISSVTLWAPACTMKLFHEAYLPAIKAGRVRKFSLFTLKDAAEQDDDCAKIYNKSLLYLVSNSFEEKHGLLWADGAAILGMEKFILRDKAFKVPSEKDIKRDNPNMVPLFGLPSAQWIRCPNALPVKNPDASHARRHGDFDDDQATVEATLARILGLKASPVSMEFSRSKSSLRDSRRLLEDQIAG